MNDNTKSGKDNSAEKKDNLGNGKDNTAKKKDSTENNEAPKKNLIEDSELKDTNFQQGDHNVQKITKMEVKGDAVEKKVEKNITIIRESLSRDSLKFFSVEQAFPFKDSDIKDSHELFVYPHASFGDLRTRLEQHRMLLLTGPPESGKLFTVKHLAFGMKKKLGQQESEVLWYNSEAAECEIQLGDLIKHSGELKNKILIFNNIFAQNTVSIARFFRSLNPQELVDNSDRLQRLDAFLLFTADNGTFESTVPTHMPFKQDIVEWDHGSLKEGLEKKLEHFCKLPPGRDPDKAKLLLDARENDIIKEGKRMPRIALFIDTELDQILAGKAVEDSIKEFFGDPRESIKKWFFNDIASNNPNFEASTFALCLALFNGITYADFLIIHREITTLLLKKFIPYKNLKEFTFMFVESIHLDRCRASISKNGASNAFRIEFNDNEYRNAVLHILRNNYKKVLLLLVPFLVQLVQETESRQLRKKAMHNLVDIGTMAPETIIIPAIYKWAQEKNRVQWINIGYLYETIFNNEDENVKNYCMKVLKEITSNGQNHEQIIPVIAYRQIGFKHLEFAMAQLRDILEKVSKWKLREYFISRATIRDDKELIETLETIYDDEEDVLPLVGYSIVDMAIHHTPINLFKELKKWIDIPNNQSKEWAVFFVMGPYGILEELEGLTKIYSIDGENGKKKNVSTNYLLFPLTSDDEAGKNMADFLHQLYSKCFVEYKTNVSGALKKKLFKHMEKWVVNNLSNIGVMEGLKGMLTFFYHAGDKNLKEMLWNSITCWKVETKEEKKMDDFINDVRRRFFTSKGVKKW